MTFTDKLIVYALGMFLLGLLVLCLGLVFRHTAVEDQTDDSKTFLYDALRRGDRITSGRYAGLHEGCANAWMRAEYGGMCPTCRGCVESEVTQ